MTSRPLTSARSLSTDLMASVSEMPTRLVWIKPKSTRFALAYGGFVASYSRPAMVTAVRCNRQGGISAIRIAPLTSSLNPAVVSHAARRSWISDARLQCDPTAWAPVSWCDPAIPAPPSTQAGVLPLCIPLNRTRSFSPRPSHVWIKDEGEWITAEEWATKEQQQQAWNLDSDVALDKAGMARCRRAWRGISE